MFLAGLRVHTPAAVRCRSGHYTLEPGGANTFSAMWTVAHCESIESVGLVPDSCPLQAVPNRG